MKLDLDIELTLLNNGEEGRDLLHKLNQIPDYAQSLGPVTKGFLETLEGIHELLCADQMPGKPQLITLLDTVHKLIKENFEFRTIIDALKLSAIKESICRHKEQASGEHNFAGRRGVSSAGIVDPLVKPVTPPQLSRDEAQLIDVMQKTPDERGREWALRQQTTKAINALDLLQESK